MQSLPQTGYLRLTQIIGKPSSERTPAIPAIIPVSKSTWWAGVRSGRYPAPTRALGVRITAWDVASIRDLVEAASPSKDSGAKPRASQTAEKTANLTKPTPEGKGDGR